MPVLHDYAAQKHLDPETVTSHSSLLVSMDPPESNRIPQHCNALDIPTATAFHLELVQYLGKLWKNKQSLEQAQ
jgi:hypothetical protein